MPVFGGVMAIATGHFPAPVEQAIPKALGWKPSFRSCVRSRPSEAITSKPTYVYTTHDARR